MRLTLARVDVKTTIGLLATATVILLGGTAIAHVSAEGSLLYKIGSRVNLGAEGNLGAWFSSMLLFGIAVAALFCMIADRDAGRLRRVYQAGWLGVAALFCALSLDELGSLHERIIDFSQLDRLVLWLVAFAVAIPAFLSGFSILRLRSRPRSFFLLLLGVVVLCTIPAQEFLEIQLGAAEGGARSVLSLVAEEGLELLGMLLILAAFLFYLQGAGSLVVRTSSTIDLAIAGTIVSVAGALSLLQATLLAPPGEILGNVDNWMPAIVALLASMIAWLRYLESPGREAGRDWWLVAALGVLLSAYVGGNQYLPGENQVLHWAIFAFVALSATGILLPLGLRSHGWKRSIVLAAWGCVLMSAAVPTWAVPMAMLLASVALLAFCAGSASSGRTTS